MYVSSQVNLNVFYLSVYFNLPCTSYFLILSDIIYQMVSRVKLPYIILSILFASSKRTRPSTRFQHTKTPLEVLPPLYIFDSEAENSENFKIKPSWVEGLPTVTGKFGRYKKFLYHSSVDVWKKGYMDESLSRPYIQKIVLSTYSNASRTTEQDYRTGQLLKRPILLEVDSGYGRLSKSEDNVDFRWRMWERRIVIILGLPDAIEATQ